MMNLQMEKSTFDNTPINNSYDSKKDLDMTRNESSAQINASSGELKESMNPRQSILLTSSQRDSMKVRTDSYGVLIKHHAKDHKIKFKTEITEVNEIENWKQYNQDDRPCCMCNVM